jgi:hypothetical protein
VSRTHQPVFLARAILRRLRGCKAKGNEWNDKVPTIIYKLLHGGKGDIHDVIISDALKRNLGVLRSVCPAYGRFLSTIKNEDDNSILP